MIRNKPGFFKRAAYVKKTLTGLGNTVLFFNAGRDFDRSVFGVLTVHGYKVVKEGGHIESACDIINSQVS
jgi:hypothetical protein